MDRRQTRTNCDEAGDYVVPNVLSPRDLVSRPDNMDETVLSSRDCTIYIAKTKVLISYTVTAQLICAFFFAYAKRVFAHDTAQILALCSFI